MKLFCFMKKFTTEHESTDTDINKHLPGRRCQQVKWNTDQMIRFLCLVENVSWHPGKWDDSEEMKIYFALWCLFRIKYLCITLKHFSKVYWHLSIFEPLVTEVTVNKICCNHFTQKPKGKFGAICRWAAENDTVGM